MWLNRDENHWKWEDLGTKNWAFKWVSVNTTGLGMEMKTASVPNPLEWETGEKLGGR